MFCVKRMKRELLDAVKKRKINYYGVLVVGIIYILNKRYLAINTKGKFQYFLQCYLNDLVCPFFFLGISQIMLIWINHEIKNLKHYISIAILIGIIWEYVAPIINPKSVTDTFDICCYLLGTIFYYILWKYEINRSCY